MASTARFIGKLYAWILHGISYLFMKIKNIFSRTKFILRKGECHTHLVDPCLVTLNFLKSCNYSFDLCKSCESATFLESMFQLNHLQKY